MKDDIVVIDEEESTKTAITDPAVIQDEEETETDALNPRIRRNDDGTVTLTLIHPVSVIYKRDGSERKDTIRELTFHRVTGADMRAVSSFTNDQERGIRLMCRLANIPVAVFDRLDGADIDGCSEVIEGFLPSSRKTGRTASAR